jgi:hypothetical protein
MKRMGDFSRSQRLIGSLCSSPGACPLSSTESLRQSLSGTLSPWWSLAFTRTLMATGPVLIPIEGAHQNEMIAPAVTE